MCCADRELHPPEIARRSTELLELLDLASAAGSLVDELSHGMRKKTSLAMALLPSPRMLFLDEPFEGIDPEGVQFPIRAAHDRTESVT